MLSQTRRFRREGDAEEYQNTPCLLFSGSSVLSAAGRIGVVRHFQGRRVVDGPSALRQFYRIDLLGLSAELTISTLKSNFIPDDVEDKSQKPFG